MPITQTTFLRTSAALLILGFVALVGIVSSTVWLVERVQYYFDAVIEAREFRTSTNALRIALQQIESSQRGFVLTQEEPYLVPYNAARDDIMPFYETLKEVVQDHHQYISEVVALEQPLRQKLAELEQTISLVREGRQDEAIRIIATDQGKETMDTARDLFTRMVADADVNLMAAMEEQRSSANILRIVAIAGGLLIVLVVGGSVWAALTYTRDLMDARLEVEAANSSLEQRVNERTQDLMRANEEVQRFAYIVTHDLRAPLVNIMGFTSELDTTMKSIQAYVMADGAPLSEQEVQEARLAVSEDLPEAIGFIRSSTRKMDGLINAILKISRDGKRPLKPETIDLQELLETNLATIQHQVQEADGTTALSVHVPSITSDRMSLEQIIGNLLDNAVKYSAPSRPLMIRISADKAAGKYVRIEIADNGRGIKAEDHQRVFDLFRRSGQQDKPGEGIGLAHVRTLVRSLGGDITLSSTFGEGTTFSIILPTDVRTITRSNA